MTNARDKANIPVLNFQSKGIDDNATSTAITISSLGLVGIGTTSPSHELEIHSTSPTIEWSDSDNNYISQITQSGSGFFITSDINGLGSSSMRFRVNGNTERMRLTATGLGIGTTSPSQTLHVLNGTSSGGLIQYDGQSNAEFGLRIQSNISGGNFESDFSNGTTALLDLFANSSATSGGDLLVARTQSSTPVLLVKGNGNVGIGTASPTDLLHTKESSGSNVSTQLLLNNQTGGSGSAGIGFQVSDDSETTAYAPKGAILFERTGANGRGAFKFMSDNANDTNSFSSGDEVMRITRDKKIGIGTTSPSTTIDAIGTNFSFIKSKTSTSTGIGGFQAFNNANAEIKLFSYGSSSSGTTYGGVADANLGVLEFQQVSNAVFSTQGNDDNGNTPDFIFAPQRSQKVIIKSNGNVGIGTSSPSVPLHVFHATNNGVAIFESGDASGGIALKDNSTSQNIFLLAEGNDFKIQTNTAERMRIESNGSVIIGATSEPNGSTGGAGFINDTNDRKLLICAVTNTSSRELIEFRNPNGTVGKIQTSASATSYSTSSDYRLKENVSYDFDATSRLKQLKPARFNFIADADTTVDGFLAHEVSDIVPEAITGTKDAVKEDGTPDYQGIDQSKLVPLLVKTIQELEARITTLEANNP